MSHWSYVKNKKIKNLIHSILGFYVCKTLLIKITTNKGLKCVILKRVSLFKMTIFYFILFFTSYLIFLDVPPLQPCCTKSNSIKYQTYNRNLQCEFYCHVCGGCKMIWLHFNFVPGALLFFFVVFFTVTVPLKVIFLIYLPCLTKLLNCETLICRYLDRIHLWKIFHCFKS